MKTRDEVERRLRKLRVRYATKHVQRSQERKHTNCVFNKEHLPRPLGPPKVAVEHEVAPRTQVTLVVLNDDRPVRICMYGVEKLGGWPGDFCDDDDTASRCPYFRPSRTIEQAKTEFLSSLEDDEHVFDNYRDVATLQWVIGERVHSIPLTWWERVWMAVLAFFARFTRRLPPAASVSIPDDLWSDPNDPSPPP